MVDAVERAFKAFAPTWPTYISDSEAAARKAWFELDENERSAAVERAGDYVSAVKASKRNICTLAVYLRDKRWLKLSEPKAVEPDARIYVKPFGQAWMAKRLALLAMERQVWRPNPFQQSMLDSGRAHLVAADRHRAEFPLVHEMDVQAENGRGVTMKARQVPDHKHLVSTTVGGDLFKAWGRWHAANDLPWVDPTSHREYIYLPLEVPEASPETAISDDDEFVQAVGL